MTLVQRKTRQHRAEAAAMQLGHTLQRKVDGSYKVRTRERKSERWRDV